MRTTSPTNTDTHEERYNGIVACSPFSPPTENHFDSGLLQHSGNGRVIESYSIGKYTKQHELIDTTIPIPSIIQSPSISNTRHNDHNIDIANYYSNEPSKSSISFSESNLTIIEEGEAGSREQVPKVKQRMSRKRLVVAFFTFIVLHTCAMLVAMGLFIGVYFSDSQVVSDPANLLNGTSVNSTLYGMSSNRVSIPLYNDHVDINITNSQSMTLFEIIWNTLIGKL